MTPEVRSVLLKVRDEILTDESKWAQGDDVILQATPTCLGMAIVQACGDPWLPIVVLAQRALGFKPGEVVSIWNDAPERTFADVRAVLDRALADEVAAS